MDTMRQIDSRRDLMVPGNKEATVRACVDHFIETAQKAIKARGLFSVALSGGSTPKVVIEGLAARAKEIDWTKCHIFWSDERSCAPDHADSNYGMAMKAGLSKLPIPSSQIHRMIAESNIEQHASNYEATIRKLSPTLDLVLLGMGDDGHIASLFPGTAALKETKRLVVPNYVPQKDTWRMTFTYPLINSARATVLYVIGDTKAPMLHTILVKGDPTLPATHVGTPSHPALWIADEGAAKLV